jgi:hypothetical protein
VLRHNAAWGNVGNGFSDGVNPGVLDIRNNTSFRNGGTGFAVGRAPVVLEANISVDDGADTSMFRSTEPATAAGPRQPDGRLPVTDFLVSSSGSGAAMTPS